MALSSVQKSQLNAFDRSVIENEIADLRFVWQSGHWLPSHNRYLRDCIQKIKDDTAAHRNLVHSHMRQYIAASAVIHCFDGWAFLSRAVDAELSGDPNAARHFGYYAELRAAMSLLASCGIGVFDKKHIVVKADGRCHGIQNSPPTHIFAWDALEYWANSSTAVHVVLSSISPGAVKLDEWLNQLSVRPHFMVLKWMTEWGLDLARVRKDQKDRNVSSYRPTPLSTGAPREISEVIKTVTRMWKSCEPSGANAFSVLDRHLLRNTVELAFKVSFSRSPKQAHQKYKKYIEMMLHGVSPSELTEEQWQDFFDPYGSWKSIDLIKDAGVDDPVQSVNHSKQLLSRALLLLRVSTGSLNSILKNANVDLVNDLSFWIYGPRMCKKLWTPGEGPDDFFDLWADVDEAIQSLTDWADDTESEVSLHNLWQQRAVQASTLSCAESMPLWELCS